MVGFRKNGMVSLWVCRQRHDDYETGFDPLKDAFGIGYYDIDSHEAVGDPSWGTQSLSDLLQQLSYATSFIDAALDRAREMGVSRGRRAIALYDFAYEPAGAKVVLPQDPVFLGAFKWNDNEDRTWFERHQPKKEREKKRGRR